MSEQDHDKSQADKFRALARKLDCDEDEVRFEDQVRRIAKEGREPEPAPKPD